MDVVDTSNNQYVELGHINLTSSDSWIKYRLIDNGDGSNITILELKTKEETYSVVSTGKLFYLVYKIIEPLLNKPLKTSDPNTQLDIYLYNYDRTVKRWKSNNKFNRQLSKSEMDNYDDIVEKLEILANFVVFDNINFKFRNIKSYQY